MKSKAIVIFLLFLISPFSVYASENPFVKGSSGKKSVTVAGYPKIVRQIIYRIAPLQRDINRKRDSMMMELRDNPTGKLLFTVIFVSFLLGAIHALGPGHGKIITFTYFMSRKAAIVQGIIAGNLIALLHVTSASIIVLGLYFLVKSSFLSAFENINGIIKLVSYAFITALGIYLFAKAYISFRKGRLTHEHDHIHVHENIENKSLLPAVFIIGIVPCPRAAIILKLNVAIQNIAEMTSATLLVLTGLLLFILNI